MADGAFDPRSLIDYTTALDAALELADIGVPVFPVVLTYNEALAKHEKKPVISNWRNNASADERQIRQWFTNTRVLIGVPTGVQSGWDVVDIDPRHGGDVWLKENRHRLPATATHQTMQSGVHLLFRHHPGMRSSAGKIAPGVDVRGEGGFIVYWPGHGFPISGGAIAPWPAWLIELATHGHAPKTSRSVPLNTRRPPSAQAVVDLLRRIPNSPETQRDVYEQVAGATAGCRRALDEAGELTPDDEVAIEDAIVAWAELYCGKTDERNKWREDWIHRGEHAGWQSLTKVADALIPGHALERAAEDFNEYDNLSEPTSAGGDPNWMHRLRRTKNKAVKAGSLLNVYSALRYAPDWQSVLAWNKFRGGVDILARPPYATTFGQPRQLENIDIARTKVWLERYGIDASTELVQQGINVVAADSPYHPVLTMLDGLVWDGVPRLDTWMHRHLGVENTDLHRAYSARFLISMIARVRDPGCKVDTVPIFEGPQGLQRSTLLQELAAPLFTDHVPNLDSKDAQLQLHGVWLVEFAEYGNLGKADANRAKNFITTRVDRLRKPYGEVVEDMQRQSVMAVTLNPEAHPYLKDATGNRRLWPMLCGTAWEPGRLVDLDAFRRERPQLLAEADHRYGQGEWWWLHEPALITAHRESVIKRVDGGPLLESVSRAVHALVEKGEDLTFRTICSEMGLLSAKDLSFAVQRNVGQAMTLLGYRGERRDVDGVRLMFYILVESATGEPRETGLS